jgi:hypothetical protein
VILPCYSKKSNAPSLKKLFINKLARKGFLIIKPSVGSFVDDYRRNGTLETLVSIMNYNGGIGNVFVECMTLNHYIKTQLIYVIILRNVILKSALEVLTVSIDDTIHGNNQIYY